MELIDAPQAIPTGLDGISFAPTLLGQSQEPRPFLYREFPAYGGQQSVRIGDWKGIRQNLNPPGQQKKPELRTELYNLNEDEAEQRDVSAANPQMVARIECIMREQHTKSGLFPFPALDE